MLTRRERRSARAFYREMSTIECVASEGGASTY